MLNSIHLPNHYFPESILFIYIYIYFPAFFTPPLKLFGAPKGRQASHFENPCYSELHQLPPIPLMLNLFSLHPKAVSTRLPPSLCNTHVTHKQELFDRHTGAHMHTLSFPKSLPQPLYLNFLIQFLSLLPPLRPTSPALSNGGWSCSGVGGIGADVDLPLLDLVPCLRGQVLYLLLGLQVKHDISQLLLQLCYGCILPLTWRITVSHTHSYRTHRGHSAMKLVDLNISAGLFQVSVGVDKALARGLDMSA